MASTGYTISLTINADGTQDGTITNTSTGASVATIHINADGSGYVIDTASGTKTEFSAPS